MKNNNINKESVGKKAVGRRIAKIDKKIDMDEMDYTAGIIYTMREPLVVLDQDLKVVFVSPAFYKVFHVKPEETLGQLIYNLGNKQWNIPKLRTLLENIIPKNKVFDNFKVEHKFDRLGKRVMLLNARQIEKVLGKEQVILLAIEDITNRARIEANILQLSYHDQLTGLYNRRFFEEEVLRLNTKRQLPLSIIMGDLNSLKLINDTFGHLEGDKLLKKTTKLLKGVCRSEDIIARWGGDEFIILLTKTPYEVSEDIVRRIKKVCSKLIIQNMPLSLSMGLSTKTEEGQDIDDIIIDAESNMYKHKLIEKESNGNSIISALEQTLFEKSNETREHAIRIKDSAIKLGESIKLHSHQIDELTLLASLHDIGKVAISEAILLKETKLTEKDWEIIKKHPGIGFNIAQSSTQISHIAKYILACHENWDGSGYPKGLSGEAIPIISRIIFIADAYDVMTNPRIYKKAIGKDNAIEELKRCSGSQFDPILINEFLKIIQNGNGYCNELVTLPENMN